MSKRNGTAHSQTDRGGRPVDYSPGDFYDKFRESVAHEASLGDMLRAASSPDYARTADELARDISDGCEASNSLLRLAGFPMKFRPIVDALIGLAGEHVTRRWADLDEADPQPDHPTEWDTEWFTAPMVVIGQAARLVRDGKFETSERAAEQWASRNIRALKGHQRLASFAFFEIEEGDFDRETRRNRPTRFRVPFIRFVTETVIAARGKFYYRRQPRRAIREAARALLNDVPDVPFIRERRPSRTLDPETRLLANRKRILTLLKQCREDIRWLGRDETGWLEKLLREEVEVFDEPEAHDRSCAENLGDWPSKSDGYSNVRPVTSSEETLDETGTQMCDPSKTEDLQPDGYSNVRPIGAQRHNGYSNVWPVPFNGDLPSTMESRSRGRPPDALEQGKITHTNNNHQIDGDNFSTLDEATIAVGVSTDRSDNQETGLRFEETIKERVHSLCDGEEEEAEWTF